MLACWHRGRFSVLLCLKHNSTQNRPLCPALPLSLRTGAHTGVAIRAKRLPFEGSCHRRGLRGDIAHRTVPCAQLSAGGRLPPLLCGDHKAPLRNGCRRGRGGTVKAGPYQFYQKITCRVAGDFYGLHYSTTVMEVMWASMPSYQYRKVSTSTLSPTFRVLTVV